MAYWSRPSLGFKKVNVGAIFSREQRAAGVGCVIKDHEGQFMKASAGLIGLAPPIAADLWALYYGLKLSWELNGPDDGKRFVVETDSAAAIDAVMHEDPAFPFAELVSLIKAVMGEAWTTLEVNLIHSDANLVAATLASESLAGSGGIELFNSAPECVRDLIRNEA